MGSEQSGAQELTGDETAGEELEPEHMELTITSDGTPHGTTITDNLTGRPLFYVSEVRLHIKVGEPAGTAEIVLMKPQIKLTGRFKVVEESGS